MTRVKFKKAVHATYFPLHNTFPFIHAEMKNTTEFTPH